MTKYLSVKLKFTTMTLLLGLFLIGCGEGFHAKVQIEGLFSGLNQSLDQEIMNQDGFKTASHLGSYTFPNYNVGQFNLTDIGKDRGVNFKGNAELYSVGGQTQVRLSLFAVDRNKNYVSHVHNQPCSEGGGGHYLLDPSAGAGEDNEIKMEFQGRRRVSQYRIQSVYSDRIIHDSREDARSIVVHDSVDKAKIACADLAHFYQTGSPEATAEGQARGYNLSGYAFLRRRVFSSVTKTVSTVMISGLEDQNYGAHVHNLPCSEGGGGHYKIDPSVAGVVKSNEAHLPLKKLSNRDLWVGGVTLENHIARPEAESIVIHDQDGARIGCIQLY